MSPLHRLTQQDNQPYCGGCHAQLRRMCQCRRNVKEVWIIKPCDVAPAVLGRGHVGRLRNLMLSTVWYSVSPYMHTEKKRRCHAKPVVPPFSTPAMAKSGGVDFCLALAARGWMCGRKATWRRRVAIGVEPCKADNTTIMISGADSSHRTR